MSQKTQQEVEVLFQTKSIAEVREVETKTRHEIEEKKKQLRQVVGNSYRDLISSADTIIDISQSCHNVVGLVGEVQNALGRLSISLLERKHTAQEEHAATSYDRLYALGSRVKYLIDTPENIWGCLDAKDYLEASRRYVRSAEVHKSLMGHSKQILHRFPLLQHQWPLVKKFRSQIWDRAIDWLGSQGELTSEQLAFTLVALSLLKPMDGAELLKTYLSARQRYITQCLEAAAAGGGESADLETLTFILGDVLVLVYRVVAQCGELFLQLPGVTSAPLLVKVLDQDDLGLADLTFDAHPDAKSEIAAWKVTRQSVRERLTGIQPAGVATQCTAWLDILSSQFKALGGKLLGSCSSGPDLLAVESGVKAALDAWKFELQPDSTLTAEASASIQDDFLQPPAPSLNWNDASQWVLGRPLGLWPLLMEHALVERAKQLVARDFTTVTGEVVSLLGKALEEAEVLPHSTPGGYRGTNWSEMVVLQPGTPLASNGGVGKRRRLSGRRRHTSDSESGGAESREGGAGLSMGLGWLQQTERALQVFDQQLSSALAAALDACYGPTPEPEAAISRAVSSGGSTSSTLRKPLSGEYAAGRALILEPFVQERCLEATQAIAASLEDHLHSLPSPYSSASVAAVGAAAYAPTAQKSLIIGRVALAIAGRSTALRTILGPPELWKQQEGTVRGAASQELARRLGLGLGGRFGASLPSRLGATALTAADVAQTNAKLEQVQQRFRSLGLQSYTIWASWASQSISTQLLSKLATDLALVADLPLRGWEETVVSPGGDADEELDVGGELGPDAGEMRFWLPAAPSAAAMEMAMGACQEADHAGGHLIDDECLAMLKWHLGGALVGALGSALAPGGVLQERGLSEKGILQVLFDLRFLHDLLSGGGPVSTRPEESGPAATIAAMAARRRELSKVEEELQALVDPIDWATYESYLYANKEKFTARCQVLFGLLLRSGQGPQQQRRGSSLATPASSTGDSNVLRMAAGGPRFSYLPVNTPALLRQPSLPHMGSGQHLGSATSLNAGGASVLDKYSFASGFSLFGNAGGVARSGSSESDSSTHNRSRPGSSISGGISVSGPGGTGVGASALEALRHSRFGSLLGDKAAEVSAMASGVTQSLGEYSFSTTLSGALGGGAGGLLSSFNLPGAFKAERGGR